MTENVLTKLELDLFPNTYVVLPSVKLGVTETASVVLISVRIS